MPGLNTDVRYIKGIGEQRAKSLAKLGISTLRDLICHFPRTYEDRTVITSIAAAQPDENVCVCAMVVSQPRLSRIRQGLELVKFRAVDDSGSIDITYFNQAYVRDQLKEGHSYVFYGRVTVSGTRKSMTNPIFEDESAARTVTGRIVPIYSLKAGISQKILMNSIKSGLEACQNELPNSLPESVCRKHSLAQPGFSYNNIHFPNDMAALELARRRLIFEELFVLAAALRKIKGRNSDEQGLRLNLTAPDEFISTLPFQPTGAQSRAIDQAYRDMSSGGVMNRLVQGDVGSGKTLAAAACAWLCFKNGYQTAFMAPTEILAEQHMETFQSMLSPLGVEIALLTGSTPARQKRDILARLASGEIDLIVGTHALLTDTVSFDRLALVITDEQHRFGVAQRSKLNAKGSQPHVLVMSATPIPRTLALMLYGDLDVSVIDELPPGRQKVDTFLVDESYRQRINKFIRRHVAEGRQVFIICPTVEENEMGIQGLKSVNAHTKELAEKVFPDLRVGCIHGKLKPKAKEAAMRAFVSGEVDILVSTTVVEVGVDVPNAALIVIENAERFGLSQLHQLRGRVGRGRHKSYCVLFSDNQNEETQRRLKVLCKTNDGFVISEEDLNLRGPGDFFGSRQHGLPEMKIADLCSDMDILLEAQEAAQELLNDDPELLKPENAPLSSRIAELFDLNSNSLN